MDEQFVTTVEYESSDESSSVNIIVDPPTDQTFSWQQNTPAVQPAPATHSQPVVHVKPVEQDLLEEQQQQTIEFLPVQDRSIPETAPQTLVKSSPADQDLLNQPIFSPDFTPVHDILGHMTQQKMLPEPIGDLPARDFTIRGVILHDFDHVNFNPGKLFTRFLLWFVEINDALLEQICPSHLNDMPCEWDELEGGCRMLRLSEMKQKHPHPFLSQPSICDPNLQDNCVHVHVHDIQPTCRSIAQQLELPKLEQFRPAQLCEVVARGEGCERGHDLESARAEAVHRYWVHLGEARRRGSVGIVKGDILARPQSG